MGIQEHIKHDLEKLDRKESSLLESIKDIIASLLGTRYCGSMTLTPSAPHQITIPLGFKPSEVWISLDESKAVPVCVGDVDCFDIKIVPTGFMIISKITSNSRVIKWFAIR